MRGSFAWQPRGSRDDAPNAIWRHQRRPRSTDIAFALNRWNSHESYVLIFWTGSQRASERGRHSLLHAFARNELVEIETHDKNLPAAVEAATLAYQLAWCDGRPFAYDYGLRTARAHLQALGAPEPEMPPYDASKHEPIEEIRAVQTNRSRSDANHREPSLGLRHAWMLDPFTDRECLRERPLREFELVVGEVRLAPDLGGRGTSRSR